MSALDPNVESLLERYRPELRYDSLESFFADSAGVITDRPGNLLKRKDGTVIAAAAPAAGQPKLSLAFLARQHYANGQPVAATDYVDEVGSNYVAQSRQIRSQPGYADRVHGRAVSSGGATWLQYWFFMYYDDPGFLGFGTHEGDIEMIQLRLDAQGKPTAASYSQHSSGVRAAAQQLEWTGSPDGQVPVVYSARGSHANMLRAGEQLTDLTPIPDHNDGKGHRVRPELIVLTDSGAPWSLWPGFWGSTRASGIFGGIGIESNSPAAMNQHLSWRNPAGFHADCEDAPDDLPPPGQQMTPAEPAPPAPTITARAEPGATVVNFTIPAAAVSSTSQIVAGLFTPGAEQPSLTASAEVTGTSGTIELPPAPAGATVEVRATAHAENGVASDTAKTSVAQGAATH